LQVVDYLIQIVEVEYKDPLEFKKAYLNTPLGPDDKGELIPRLKLKDYLK
jgi:hypothetical protein